MIASLKRRVSHTARGSIRYGPLFFVEVTVFWLVVQAVNSSGYGNTVPAIEPVWTFWISFAIVALAMGAAEAWSRS
jgi:hypothetical protein